MSFPTLTTTMINSGSFHSYFAQNKIKKATLLVAGYSVILVTCAAAVSVSRHNGGVLSSDGRHQRSLWSSSKAVEAICKMTEYRKECERSLGGHAGEVIDPKMLVQLIFNATIDGVRQGIKRSSFLVKATKDPRTRAALRACDELLDYAVDDLQNSFNKFRCLHSTKVRGIVDDLRVWLSAAITYQHTCLDELQDTTGDAAESMAKVLNSSSALTSNSLAIIDRISSALTSVRFSSLHRRMHWKDFPPWVRGEKRRLISPSVVQMKANATVAQDGNGQYKTIAEALATVPKKSNTTYVIYVKEGVYKENVQVDRSMTNVMMIGDGATKTKITGNLNYVDGTPTFKTATLAVVGDGFIGKDFGVENTAGAAKHQAVALRVQSDKSVFYHCQMEGFQDTLYAHTKRQFYRECTISGTIDFLFGDSSVIFQNCLLLVRRPLDNQQCICTAQGRRDHRETTGIVLHNCTISADASLQPEQDKFKVYLGRPWKEYSRTVIVQSQIDGLIDSAGWMPWQGDFGLDTCYYAEVDNRGTGSGTANRATWKGIVKINRNDVQEFSVKQFIQGDTWLPATGVPFIAGLL